MSPQPYSPVTADGHAGPVATLTGAANYQLNRGAAPDAAALSDGSAAVLVGPDIWRIPATALQTSLYVGAFTDAEISGCRPVDPTRYRCRLDDLDRGLRHGHRYRHVE
jgi:hypothetical protein